MSKFEDFLLEFNFTHDYSKAPKRPKSHWDESDNRSQNKWSVDQYDKDGNFIKSVKKFPYENKRQAEAYASACNRKSDNKFKVIETS